jgi:hypothetical protein
MVEGQAGVDVRLVRDWGWRRRLPRQRLKQQSVDNLNIDDLRLVPVPDIGVRVLSYFLIDASTDA